ncbi:MAG: outer membrane lipoprotein-sorting protein [Myxococcales bacterium FL481]|nr:MAG: outer membrane lipoprotein-sorting protein [Myxococcales bacterium FL481]
MMSRPKIALFVSAFLLVPVWSAAMSAPANATVAPAPSGRAIMDKVAETRKLAGSEAVVTMTIINAKGAQQVRKLAMATKLYDGGKTEKRIYSFLEPADVKGTGVLTFDYADKDDDIWVYLPALRKTRRIVSSKKSKSFMGSEFSYADLNIPKLAEFRYQVLREEKLGGVDCWVVETTPTSEKIAESEGYSKKTYWVAKADYTIRKGLYYDLDGALLKELTSKDIKCLDPANQRFRSMHMEMVNKQNGRRSVFVSDKVVLSPNVKDELFTTRYLERV